MLHHKGVALAGGGSFLWGKFVCPQVHPKTICLDLPERQDLSEKKNPQNISDLLNTKGAIECFKSHEKTLNCKYFFLGGDAPDP